VFINRALVGHARRLSQTTTSISAALLDITHGCFIPRLNPSSCPRGSLPLRPFEQVDVAQPQPMTPRLLRPTPAAMPAGRRAHLIFY
jgi:hypothetical protein